MYCATDHPVSETGLSLPLAFFRADSVKEMYDGLVESCSEHNPDAEYSLAPGSSCPGNWYDWFNGVSGREELEDLALYGVSDSSTEAICEELSAPSTMGRRIEWTRDFDGQDVDIDLALEGEEKCFRRMRRTVAQCPVVKLIVDTRVTGEVDKEDVERVGRILASVCIELENKGWMMDVHAICMELFVADGYCSNPEVLALMDVPVKLAGDPLIPELFMYPIVSASFQRCLGFAMSAATPLFKCRRTESVYGGAVKLSGSEWTMIVRSFVGEGTTVQLEQLIKGILKRRRDSSDTTSPEEEVRDVILEMINGKTFREAKDKVLYGCE